MDLIIASNNLNKIKEIKELLSDLDINVLSLKDIGFTKEIDETGTTFEDNSYIKAKTIYDLYHLPVIADDSGLEVRALNNAPGVYSHRYAGSTCKDSANNEKLISELKGITDRAARYVCVISYINELGAVKYAKGYCEGEIIDTPKGNNGFGYDPYFYIKEYNKTMAEISMDEKNKISHRAKALNNLKDIINEDITSKR